MKKKLFISLVVVIAGAWISEAIDAWTGAKPLLHTLPAWARLTQLFATMGFGLFCGAVAFWIAGDF